MTLPQENAMSLFSQEALDKVKAQFKSGTEIVQYKSFDMSFRFFRASDDNINLEALVLMELPNQNEKEIDFGSLGKAKSVSQVMFFKPIGFYNRVKDFFSDNFEVTILKEFEEAFDYLDFNRKIPSNIKVNKMTLLENAILTAFSMEALIRAKNYEDCSFYANGIKADIFMSFDGYPQVFLDDRYGIQGPIAAYMLREKGVISPIITYQVLFNKFDKMNLMTAFKRI